jgi:hypothetical protein
MFWKLTALALLGWALGLYFSVTIGGLIHLLPAGVLVAIIVRRASRTPNTEYGRWRSAAERMRRP